jgi:methylene-tetrahydromethanopterin dehydrogenase
VSHKRLLYIVSADPQVSPFDINMAYDAGFDAVVPYAGVAADAVRGLTQDMMFSRGPKGARATALLVTTSDPGEAEATLRAADAALFDPFRIGLMIDPRGGYTTAAALIAKCAAILRGRGRQGLKGARVLILGGTGGVGRAAAMLAAAEGARVVLASRTPERAASAARQIRDLFGAEVAAEVAADEGGRVQLARQADLILATGSAGVTLLSSASVSGLEGPLLLADVNAVPPAGIDGVQPKDDGAETRPGIVTLGALAVGHLKMKVEAALLAELLGDGAAPRLGLSEARRRADAILAGRS